MVGDHALQGACRFGVVLGEGGSDEVRHDPPGLVVDGDGRGHRDDTAGLAHLHIACIHPEIGSVALERSIEEALDLVVDLAARLRDLALGDPALTGFEGAPGPPDRRGAQHFARNNAPFDEWGAHAVPLIAWRGGAGGGGWSRRCAPWSGGRLHSISRRRWPGTRSYRETKKHGCIWPGWRRAAFLWRRPTVCFGAVAQGA